MGMYVGVDITARIFRVRIFRVGILNGTLYNHGGTVKSLLEEFNIKQEL